MKTVLVTGGAGFIGSNLVAELARRGDYHIVVCDVFGTSDKWRNLAKHPVWETVSPDKLFDWLDSHRSELEMIFHLGAVSSTTERDIDYILENNFHFSLRLWRWCVANEMRFLYTSSSATYGSGGEGFDDSMELEYLKKLHPLSGYGWSKNLFDMHVATSLQRKGTQLPQWVGLKLFNAYGPNEYHKEEQRSVICQIGEQAINASLVRLFRSYNAEYADGEQKRDMIYVKDIVRVMLWFLDNPKKSGLYNLGTGRARTFKDMALAVFDALGKPQRINYIDMPPGLIGVYQYFTQAKMDKLREAGYEHPFTSIEDGISDYVLNYLTKEDHYL